MLEKFSECPDIGSTIENYVKSAGVGADTWRRTGILTFDGNRKVEKKKQLSVEQKST